MSNFLELNDVYNKKGIDFLKNLFDSHLIVFKKNNSSDLYVQRNLNTFNFFKKKEEPIDLIDRTLTSLYEKGIFYFENLSTDIIKLLPLDWVFCFDYFPESCLLDSNNINIGIILNRILVKKSNKTIETIEDPLIISKYSSILGVKENIPLFAGRLNKTQQTSLLEFVNNQSIDNFNFFVDTVTLNSNLINTEFNKIDLILFKFIENNLIIKIINPNKTYSKENKKESNDIISILLLDILNFLDSFKLKQSLDRGPLDLRYINLICFIYNEYMSLKEKDLQLIDFKTGEFAKSDEYQLNIKMIPIEKTKEIIGRSENNKIVFQIILNSFRKYKKYKVDTFLTVEDINNFNLIINKIIYTIEKEGFKTFNDYKKKF